MKNKKSFWFILVLIIFIILLSIFEYKRSKNNQELVQPQEKVLPNKENTPVATPVSISNNYLNLNLPFSLSTEQIKESLNTGKVITITPVTIDWPDIINGYLLKNDWKLSSLQKADDGGSEFYYYMKTQDLPAMKLSYRWDAAAGKYKSLDIEFMPKSKMESLY